MSSVFAILIVGLVLATFGLMARSRPQRRPAPVSATPPLDSPARRIGRAGIQIAIVSALASAALSSAALATAAAILGVASIVFWAAGLPAEDCDQLTQQSDVA